jgi:hypothetical protein
VTGLDSMNMAAKFAVWLNQWRSHDVRVCWIIRDKEVLLDVFRPGLRWLQHWKPASNKGRVAM